MDLGTDPLHWAGECARKGSEVKGKPLWPSVPHNQNSERWGAVRALWEHHFPKGFSELGESRM